MTLPHINDVLDYTMVFNCLGGTIGGQPFGMVSYRSEKRYGMWYEQHRDIIIHFMLDSYVDEIDVCGYDEGDCDEIAEWKKLKRAQRRNKGRPGQKYLLRQLLKEYTQGVVYANPISLLKNPATVIHTFGHHYNGIMDTVLEYDQEAKEAILATLSPL